MVVRPELLVVLFAVCAGVLQAADPGFDGFPFQIPYGGLVEGTAPADLAEPHGPAGADGFVAVDGGRFVLSLSGRPIRFWGTNLTAGGCFPPHDVAERMARRLATLGINCVRLVGFDGPSFPDGLWTGDGAWTGGGHKEFDPVALDRFDYLVSQLKENGIYVDLSLHVFLTYGPADGFPPVGPGESLPEWGKGVGQFYPACIRLQERFARMLLEHINPYTGNPYAGEPAVAFLEISNEDGLAAVWNGQFGGLENLPAAYHDELTRQWNAWLSRRYASTDELRAAWAEGEDVGEGEDMLSAESGVHGLLQVAGTSQAEAEGGGTLPLRIRVSEGSDTGWHVNYQWLPFAVKGGERYVLRMTLAANRPFEADVACTMSDSPWTSLGLYTRVPVGTEPTAHELYFTATRDYAPRADGTGGARILLSNMAQAGLEVTVSDVSLHRAESRGLLPGERLGRVAWVKRSQLGGRTAAVQHDVVGFLEDTERAYWDGMRAYLKETLGARMPVTTTSVGNTSPLMAAATADYVDGHAYWQHPQFPGRPWDPTNWVVPDLAMVNDQVHSTIARLTGGRVLGLPYVISEYNHPAPQDWSAEGFPLVAVYGAFQGWDGLLTYNYAHGRWEIDRFDSFFDIMGHPVKLALMPACSSLFRGGGIAPAQVVAATRLTPDDDFGALTRGIAWESFASAYSKKIPEEAWAFCRVGVEAAGLRLPEKRPRADESVEWSGDGRGAVAYCSDRCVGLIGFVSGRRIDFGPLSVTVGSTSLDGFAVVMVSPVDGQAAGEPGRVLITAVSRCENEGMTWNDDRSSVGRGWGTGPTLCEGVPLTLRCTGAGQVRLFPLKADGTRSEEVLPAPDGPVGLRFRVGPQQQTLWYELLFGE